MSPWMAAHAASFSVWCVAKSGKPCDKLTASNSCASRVISRITDSVNCVAFFDPLGFNMYKTLSFTTEDTEDIQRGILSFRKELSRVRSEERRVGKECRSQW